MHIIYKHTTPNGKVYIGQTKQTLNKRWISGKGYKGCPYFKHAIEKYGWDNITHEVLCECETHDEANDKEKEYIRKFNSNSKKYGYNLTDGGQGTTGRVITDEFRHKLSVANKGRVVSTETRQKIRESILGHKHSEETKAKMSATRKGNKYRLGTKMSEADKLKRSLSERGGNNPHARKVLCVETGIVYGSVTEAMSATGATKIYDCCLHIPKHKTSGGYHWEYVE